MAPPAILIAAPMSKSGKSTVTLAIVRALRKRGLQVGCFKVGPDYIDSAYLSRAAGRPCLNLDSWAMRFDTLMDSMEAAGRDSDILIGEGVMGLFDGAPDGTGSTADIASLFDLPVVFVMNVASMGASAGALAEGFIRFREDVEVAGLILNRVGSPAHERIVHDACDERFSTPILGSFMRDPAVTIGERHLGLVQADEQRLLDDFLDGLGRLAEARLDLDRIVRIARSPAIQGIGRCSGPLEPLGQKIGIAQDVAFSFVYPGILQRWQRDGAELAFFSPLADEAPDLDCDAVFLPGGYPELHAQTLAHASRFKRAMAALEGKAVIYGECGGYMVLGRGLEDRDGTLVAMLGLLPVETSFAQPRLNLGYRRARLLAECALGKVSTTFRGHEFHYARETRVDGMPLFEFGDARKQELGMTGCRNGLTFGSFVHLVDRELQSGPV